MLRLARFFVIAPTLILIGSFLDPGPRTVLWLLAVAVDVAGILNAGRDAWEISVGHFVERYRLFVIIALGESIVAIGVGAADQPRDAETLAAILIAFAGAALVWWSYFDWIAAAGERGLNLREGRERSRAARDVFTLFHWFLVSGIVLYAVAAKELVHGPAHALSGTGRSALGTGLALMALSTTLSRYRFAREIALERLLAATVVGAVAVAGGTTRADLVFGLAVLAFGVGVAMETVRFRERRARIRSRA
jgi:low temperature requirement protein LtrA